MSHLIAQIAARLTRDEGTCDACIHRAPRWAIEIMTRRPVSDDEARAIREECDRQRSIRESRARARRPEQRPGRILAMLETQRKSAAKASARAAAAREERSEAARRGARTRLVRSTPGLPEACTRSRTRDCRRCGGSGLETVYRRYDCYDRRCQCCQQGQIEYRALDEDAIEAAWAVRRQGADAMIAAARAAGRDEGAIRYDSLSERWEAMGEIDAEERGRIDTITARRHSATDYDDLLAAGYSRDDARLLMRALEPA